MGVEGIVLTLFLLATVPSLVAAIFIWRRRRYGSLFWVILGFGAVGWFIAQLPKQIISLALFSIWGIPLDAAGEELLGSLNVVVMGALLAGVFEELLKPIGVFAFRRRISAAKDGVCYGLGAGFGAGMLEALLLGVSAYFTVISASEPLMLDMNVLLGPIERVSAIFLHAALTAFFVYFLFQNKPLLGFLMASAYHAFVDFSAVWAYYNTALDPWLVEGLVALLVVILYPFLIKLYNKCTHTHTFGV